MFSFMNFIGQFCSSFLTMVFTVCLSFFSILGGVGRELPKAPDTFTPVVRFAVCSDVHLNGVEGEEREQRLATLFDDAYAYSQQSANYKNLDAVVVVGDFTNRGEDVQYQRFNAIVSEHIKEGTQLICTVGNHEFIAYRDYDPTIGYEKYKQYICEDVDTHNVINGYHFIGVSYADDAKTFHGKTGWLKNELKAAKADTGNKPIFVFQHPQPFGTVYGSVNWGNVEVGTVLNLFPQVIDFSGHSHYNANDPRSIWQGAYTAVGTGSTAALMGNLNYIDGDKDAPGESGSFWIVEADADGNVRLQLYDIVNHKFFTQTDYYLSDITNLCKRRYTWGNLKSLDTAPQFPENSEISVRKDADGNSILVFPDAYGYYPAENYKIIVSKNIFKNVWSDTVISNYVRAESTEMTVNMGKLESGTYKVKITPYSPYAKGGQAITGTITIS